MKRSPDDFTPIHPTKKQNSGVPTPTTNVNTPEARITIKDLYPEISKKHPEILKLPDQGIWVVIDGHFQTSETAVPNVCWLLFCIHKTTLSEHATPWTSPCFRKTPHIVTTNRFVCRVIAYIIEYLITAAFRNEEDGVQQTIISDLWADVELLVQRVEYPLNYRYPHDCADCEDPDEVHRNQLVTRNIEDYKSCISLIDSCRKLVVIDANELDCLSQFVNDFWRSDDDVYDYLA